MSVVTAQPGQNPGVASGYQMMPAVQGIVVPVGMPPSMAYLAQLDEVKIHQVLHLVEVLTGFEKNNKYSVCNSQDQQFFWLQEDTDCMMRQCCGPIRSFTIDVQDNAGLTVARVTRPLRCQGICCCCCLQEMEIECPVGNKIASVREIWSCVPKYEVYDANEQLMFRIQGPCCYIKCCDDRVFDVYDAKGNEAGAVIKHWGGCREMLGQVNDFSIKYNDVNMPLTDKVILMGTSMLVDFMYFENNNK